MTENEESWRYHNGELKERYNYDENIPEGDVAFLKEKQPFVDRRLAEFSGPRSPYLWMKAEGAEEEGGLFVLWTWGEVAKPFFRFTRQELSELGK